ncbi:uncharacterized protein LOC119671747 [Teleopsis dalmanni]|uniref:uncharacterized protein LOC119671747 n=1 Tax=Teleopsis dalmanni TaxID=139649 RepID=UPI0018CD360E|nr:uncharacterized protein LOC119671747 [Teleopsis dalmanni]
MTESKITLNAQFFDDLWPLILDDNICDTKSTHKSQFFEPVNRFDFLWANNLLATKGYKDFRKAIEFRHFHEGVKADSDDEQGKDDISTIEYPGYVEYNGDSYQIEKFRWLHEWRKGVAADFANRTFPWYKAIPFYAKEIVITNDDIKKFHVPFEKSIFEKILDFKCKVMIIDAGKDVGINDFQRWLKFSAYIQIILIIRCKLLATYLEPLNIFKIIVIEENPDFSWHRQLTASLRNGHNYAVENELVKDFTTPIIFIFSSARGFCSCDSFRVIKKL